MFESGSEMIQFDEEANTVVIDKDLLPGTYSVEFTLADNNSEGPMSRTYSIDILIIARFNMPTPEEQEEIDRDRPKMFINSISRRGEAIIEFTHSMIIPSNASTLVNETVLDIEVLAGYNSE